MKKIFIIGVALLSLLTLGSCNTTKTLSQAATVASTTDAYQEVTPVSSATTSTASTATSTAKKTSTASTTAKTTTPVVQAGDRTEKITVVNSSDASLVKNYNVVVGAFGNKTNANAYVTKMKNRGYTAFLVQNESGLYRVIATGSNDRSTAVAARDKIRTTYATDDPGTCPAAWLLVPAK